MKFLAAALALGASACWGTDQVLGKIALRDIDAPTLNTLRPLFALIFIFPYTFLLGGLSLPELDLFLIAAMSGLLADFIAVEVFFYIMRRSAAHKVIPLGNSDPVWAVVIAILLLGEKPSPIVFISIVLVVLGTYLIAARKKKSSTDLLNVGVILALSVGIIWGVSVPFMKYCLDQGMYRGTLQAIRISFGAIGCGLALIVYGHGHRLEYTGRGLKVSFISGFFAYFLGFVFWLSALSIEDVSVLVPFKGVKMPVGFILSVLLLKERPNKNAAVGTILIFLAVLLITIFG